MLIWNDRRTDSTPFLRDYERLLQTYADDYTQVNHREISEDIIAAFYAPGTFTATRAFIAQMFGYTGAEGRLMSSSYVPDAGRPNHAPMLQEMHRIFDLHQVNGQVAFEYDTLIYVGQLP